MSKKRIYHISVIFFFSLFFLFTTSQVPEYEFPVYRVVIDPGHGGVSMKPRKKYGDRYDPVTGNYLDDFKEGAARGRLWEHKIVHRIGKKAMDILKYCAPGEDFDRFRKIIKKYHKGEVKRIYILSMISRGKSITRKDAGNMKEPNGEFRLFDFPGHNGKMKKGRISRINEFRPQLVLSLHLAGSAPRRYRGMNPILVAPYSMMSKGLEYLQGKRKKRSFFYNHKMNDWFEESNKRSSFEWFLNDTALYFIGYPLKRNRKVNVNEFKGYRYNMVSWAYKDDPGWEKRARKHPAGSPYSRDYKKFKMEGKFWKREQAKFEEYRRQGGIEGFGGDNAYASYELIRYMLTALKQRGIQGRSYCPGKSYVSTWILPLHVNAVCAFIELGYLNRWRDRRILTRNEDDLAEGIAVGIYSLMTGIEPRDRNFKHRPKGKRIDLQKYQISTDKSYFDAVTGD